MNFEFDKELLTKYAKVSNLLWGSAILLFMVVMLAKQCNRNEASISNTNPQLVEVDSTATNIQ